MPQNAPKSRETAPKAPWGPKSARNGPKSVRKHPLNLPKKQHSPKVPKSPVLSPIWCPQCGELAERSLARCPHCRKVGGGVAPPPAPLPLLPAGGPRTGSRRLRAGRGHVGGRPAFRGPARGLGPTGGWGRRLPPAGRLLGLPAGQPPPAPPRLNTPGTRLGHASDTPGTRLGHGTRVADARGAWDTRWVGWGHVKDVFGAWNMLRTWEHVKDMLESWDMHWTCLGHGNMLRTWDVLRTCFGRGNMLRTRLSHATSIGHASVMGHVLDMFQSWGSHRTCFGHGNMLMTCFGHGTSIGHGLVMGCALDMLSSWEHVKDTLKSWDTHWTCFSHGNTL
ncbi:uncharacterized protein [Anas acuta]|uniref:uncharacterized protein n=1 Tax=Anas acuta TaxID=28680 RepID=UPI0035C91E57